MSDGMDELIGEVLATEKEDTTLGVTSKQHFGSTVPSSDRRTLTFMTSSKITIYPGGKIFVSEKKAWINETKNQPKKQAKKKSKLEKVKVDEIEEY